jgi:hypothetical protein
MSDFDVALHTHFTAKRKKRLILIRYDSVENLIQTALHTEDERPALRQFIGHKVCIDGTKHNWEEILMNALPPTGMLGGRF